MLSYLNCCCIYLWFELLYLLVFQFSLLVFHLFNLYVRISAIQFVFQYFCNAVYISVFLQCSLYFSNLVIQFIESAIQFTGKHFVWFYVKWAIFTSHEPVRASSSHFTSHEPVRASSSQFELSSSQVFSSMVMCIARLDSTRYVVSWVRVSLGSLKLSSYAALVLTNRQQ
jgi:hypothetical protein